MTTRIKKLLSVFVIGIIAVTSCLPVFAAEHYTSFTEAEVLERIMALEAQYPTGTPWGEQNGQSCNTFEKLTHIAAFGDLPGRPTELTNLRIGDVIGFNNAHVAVVIGVDSEKITLAEGNINDQIMWGRTITHADLAMSAAGARTSYPQEGILTPANVSILRVNYYSPGKSYNILYTDTANAVPGNTSGLTTIGVSGKNIYTSLDELKAALAPYGLTITGEKSDAKVALLNVTTPSPTPVPVTSIPAIPTAPTPAASNQVNVTVNGVPVVFKDQGPIIVNGRTMLPVADIAEALGVTVNWNAETGTVEITE